MPNLKPREEIILRSIIRQYVERALPVSSSSILEESNLDISSATVRNDVARLEDEGYILRPHYAAGSIPSDLGYRYHVSALKNLALPLQEQFLIRHIFHQVEDRLEEWLNLAASVLSQQTQNVAVVTTPRPAASRFKHLELVAIQPRLALVVLVLHGAKIRQQLINLENDTVQDELSRLSQELNTLCDGLNAAQLQLKLEKLEPAEKRLVENVQQIMQAEDEHTGQEIFLDGWHYLLNQPEFSQGQRLAELMSLVEARQISRVMPQANTSVGGVQVVIGKENQAEAAQYCSLVIGNYGLPDEALGSIAVVGPTRMAYEHTISVIKYISSLISVLIAELYGVAPPAGEAQNNP
jgi:heat-inducible transcriptional repressor